MVPPLERFRYPALAAILCAGVFFLYLFGLHAFETNRQLGFPLDDPWIHLQFAKNLQSYGSFSYFKDEMVTAGSTSPLYTLLLAVGFFFTSSEMILSYVLGVLSLLAGSFFFFKIIELHRSSLAPFSALGALLLIIEPRMMWAAFSGMETTLFIALLLASLYYYQRKQAALLGVMSGLLLWTRPEAIIFFIAVVLDLVYEQFWLSPKTTKKKNIAPEKPSMSWLRRSVIIAAALAIVYFGLHLFLSGSMLPNTFAAKLKYYGGGVARNFPLEVFHYLTDGHMLAVAILCALGIATVILRALRRLPQTMVIPLAFSVGMVLAYWMKLPYLYQEGRYLMPVIPFVLLLALAGVEWVVALGAKAFTRKSKESFVIFASGSLALLLALQFALASWDKRSDYAQMCKYISDRQVRTARWLNEHTPENAIIGTHDIGAIGFYSGRKIADMVGLVSPDAIEGIGSLDKLNQFLLKHNVTHLAVLRNWFEVVNQNPIFKTDERRPEIMEVFEFKRERTHLTPQSVSGATGAAAQYLYQGQFGIAEEILRKALALDPRNSKLHHLLATLFMATNRLDEAAGGFGEALKLHPEFLEPQVGLAQVAIRQGRRDEGIALLESIAQNNPTYPTVFRALADVHDADSNKAKSYMAKFEELMKTTW